MSNGNNSYIAHHVNLWNKGGKVLSGLTFKNGGRTSKKSKMNPWQYVLTLNQSGWDVDFSGVRREDIARKKHVPDLLKFYMLEHGIIFKEIVARFEGAVKTSGSVRPVSEMIESIGGYGSFGHKKQLFNSPIGRKREHRSFLEYIGANELFDTVKTKPEFTKRHFIETIIFPLRESCNFMGLIDRPTDKDSRIYVRHTTDEGEIVTLKTDANGTDIYEINLPAARLDDMRKRNTNTYAKFAKRYGNIPVLPDNRTGLHLSKVTTSWEDTVNFLRKSGLNQPINYWQDCNLPIAPTDVLKSKTRAEEGYISLVFRTPVENETAVIKINRDTLGMEYLLDDSVMSSEQFSLQLMSNFFANVIEPSKLFKTTSDAVQERVRKMSTLESRLPAYMGNGK